MGYVRDMRWMEAGMGRRGARAYGGKRRRWRDAAGGRGVQDAAAAAVNVAPSPDGELPPVWMGALSL